VTDETRKVALVAGASGAVGGATARKLAAEGYDLALSYRSNEEAARAVAAECESGENAVRTYRATLSEYDEVAAMTAAVGADFGRLDACIYAAGPYLPQRWVSEFEPAQLASVLTDDTVGCWNLFHAAIPSLRETSGCVVSVSTSAVRRHARKDLLSSAPKAAIEAIIRAIASEEGRYGIRANAVAIGPLDDGIYEKFVAAGDVDERWLEITLSVVSLGRLGNSSDVAEAIAFLASPERAGYISGQTLNVDGGFVV